MISRRGEAGLLDDKVKKVFLRFLVSMSSDITAKRCSSLKPRVSEMWCGLTRKKLDVFLPGQFFWLYFPIKKWFVILLRMCVYKFVNMMLMHC